MRIIPLLALVFFPVTAAHAKPHTSSTVPVVMLSDIHFDPFHDPGKFAQLRSDPVSHWAVILNAPPSATQVADFDRLQSTCHAGGVDTPIELLNSSLEAARKQQPKPLFVTVSGDLTVHNFDCRFHTLAAGAHTLAAGAHMLAPGAADADYTAFAAKTVAFVALQLRRAFPHSPVYLALGNNDSGCKDYREDPNSAYLHADAASFAADAHSRANRDTILKEFIPLGDYNVALPKPMKHTRLIVLQNIFESSRYAACNGKTNGNATNDQIAWLRAQLTAARNANEHVWVMAHIPPGVDTYATVARHRDVCDGQSPVEFLKSDAFADAIRDFPGVIRLVLLGHTHMDEMRAYKTAAGVIPGKLVPSITPVDGNNPAFTVAEVVPSTATLKDYTVFAASNKTGVDTRWSEEYRYSTTYGLPDFSGASVATLTSGFLADRSGSSKASRAYQSFFFTGEPEAIKSMSATIRAAAMQIVWPTYACAITNDHAAGFRECLCTARR